MAAASIARAVEAGVGAGPPSVLQLLSFVFASADMVLEIARDDDRVTFATGASMRLLGRGSESLVGQGWRDLIDPADADLVAEALAGLGEGQRRGPFRISLAAVRGSQPAELSLFQAPQRD